jgi:predicted DNA-binding antitoxin AbrB/MazE fold protein
MAITLEAIYEDGVLEPKEPLPFKEQEQVQITVSSPSRRAMRFPDSSAGAVLITSHPCR